MEDQLSQDTVLQAVRHQDQVLDHLLSDLLFLHHEFNIYHLHNPCQPCSTTCGGVSTFPSTARRCAGLFRQTRTYPTHGVFSRHDEGGLFASPESLPPLIPASDRGSPVGSCPSSLASYYSQDGVSFLLFLAMSSILTWFVVRNLSLVPTHLSQLPQE